jgi:site-specific recombinase XerD
MPYPFNHSPPVAASGPGPAGPNGPTGSNGPNGPDTSLRLLDRVRRQTRLLHYSIRTEDAYVHWVRNYVKFHGLRHPSELSGQHVEDFLSWLASERQVSASTHRQALSALLFLYQKVLGLSLPWMQEIGRPKTRERLPVVLSHAEVGRVLHELSTPMSGTAASAEMAVAHQLLACACWRRCACASKTSSSIAGH